MGLFADLTAVAPQIHFLTSSEKSRQDVNLWLGKLDVSLSDVRRIGRQSAHLDELAGISFRQFQDLMPEFLEIQIAKAKAMRRLAEQMCCIGIFERLKVNDGARVKGHPTRRILWKAEQLHGIDLYRLPVNVRYLALATSARSSVSRWG